MAVSGCQRSCRPHYARRPTGAQFTTEKEKGRGRQTQVAQADILVRREDCRTVELVVEVEFRKNKNGDLVAPRPKDLIGLLLAPVAADNYTPSNKYLNRYELRDSRRGCRLRHESLHRRCGGTWQVARCRSADRESAWRWPMRVEAPATYSPWLKLQSPRSSTN